MAAGIKLDGRALGMHKGVMTGILVAAFWTVLNIMVIGLLITNEIIEFERIGYCIVFILITASFVGSKIAYRKVKSKRLFVSGYTAVLYFSLLLVTNILCLGGKFEAVGVTLLCICSGSFLSVLVGGPGKRRSSFPAYKKRGI